MPVSCRNKNLNIPNYNGHAIEDGDDNELQSATMATASAIHASLVTGSSSSFRQFRLTQFVDNAPKPPNATTDAQQTALVTSHRDPDIDQMAQSSRPSSGQNKDRMATSVPARLALQDHNQSNSSLVGFGTLELVELALNPIPEGILGPNKDGRVRNPVPSKLKGKTDNKQGNFGVMHMGITPGKKSEAQGRDAAAERDAAARRTSENTASRAKAAQQEKYVPPKKRGLEENDKQPVAHQTSPFPPAADHRHRRRPLAPDETKYEQARLLTLLRSINPINVVDQICKAVAYFGGIPGAPPPEDGIFPESANTRETGALFVGWLSEIFPDLSSPQVPKMQQPPHRAKKNKGPSGIGNKGSHPNEPPNSRNGFGYGHAVSAPTWELPQSLALVNTSDLNSTLGGGQATNTGPDQNKQFEPQRPTTPIKRLAEDAPSSTISASKRGRGRPKGSRNKTGKNEPQRLGDITGSTIVETDSQSHAIANEQALQSPKLQGTAKRVVKQDQPPSMQTPGDQTVATRITQPPQSWLSDVKKNNVEAPFKVAPPDELNAEELAVLNAFRTHKSPAVSAATPSEVLSKISAGSGVKRKRAPPKPKLNVTAPLNHEGKQPQPLQNASSLPPSSESSILVTKDALQWTSVDTSNSIMNPAKRQRQRKPKITVGQEPPSRNPTASVVSSGSPPIAPSTIPDSTASSSQHSIPVTRPPAEGLEAHYERFANANAQLQNGRSNTPSIISITPQQQLRQQQKPASVPAQSQQLPPQQQHHKMQQQKSHQGSQREDQAISQGMSARSSSAGFYSQQQRSQGSSYSHQYPSHQPSQLYGGHQRSPQMSNSTFRTGSMAQASPQFPQTESTYRTASPHSSIPQPAPSFAQPDPGFRSSSAHIVPQPSPTYSQPETTYRAASTNALTQQPPPAAPYPRAHNTHTHTTLTHTQTQPSHQSHYNHFPETSYVDPPTTLSSLRQLGSSSASAGIGMSMSMNMSAGGGGGGGGYGQGIAATTRSGSSNSLFGTSSLLSGGGGGGGGGGGAFDPGANDIIRGAGAGGGGSSRSGSSGGYHNNNNKSMSISISSSSGGGGGNNINNNGSSGLSSTAFDAATTGDQQQDMGQGLFRGLGRR